MDTKNARRRARFVFLPLLAACVPLTFAGAAAAQPRVTGQFALDRYEPTPIGDAFFGVQSGAVEGPLTPRFGVGLDYAHDPLVLYQSSGKTVGSVVSDQFFLDVGGSLSLFDRLQISVNLPIALVDDGQSPTNPGAANGTVIASPSGAAPGDLRVGLRLNLFREPHGVIDAGIGGYLWVPTGKQDHYTSDGDARGEPYLALSGRAGPLAYAGNFGVQIRSAVNQFVNVSLGTEVDFGVAAGLLVADDRLLIGPELIGSSVVDNGKGKTTDAELLGGAHFRLGDFVLGAGAGPGLTRGVGSPSARVVGLLAYSPDTRDTDGDGIRDREDACPTVPGKANPDPAKNGCPDRDGDGIVDTEDACPDVPGVPDPDPKKNGCPRDRDGDGIPDALDACPDVPGVPSKDPTKNGCPPDRDGDGIPDAVDACPDVPGERSPDPKKNGCPPDRDGDGVPDSVDACPDVPGIKTDDPKTNGCPGDRDGDGIRDDLDACPDEKGPPDPDPTKNGCPKLVRVTKRQIRILEQVQFAFGSAKILPVSDALLGEVAAVLKEHPEIKRVRVEGHTDNKGSAQLNLRLSKDRAASVMKWLLAHGIDAGRLEAEGFGKDRPIADNATAEGRQQNRRVEFNIVDPAPAPEAAPPALPQPGAAPPKKKP